MVSADTMWRRRPPPGRSNLSTSSTSLPATRAISDPATLSPQRRANSIATASAFTTGRMSLVEENFAIRLRPAAVNSTFGRAPPIEEPRVSASASPGGSIRPDSMSAAAAMSCSSVADGASRGRYSAGLAWKSSAPIRSEPDSSR